MKRSNSAFMAQVLLHKYSSTSIFVSHIKHYLYCSWRSINGYIFHRVLRYVEIKISRQVTECLKVGVLTGFLCHIFLWFYNITGTFNPVVWIAGVVRVNTILKFKPPPKYAFKRLSFNTFWRTCYQQKGFMSK